MGRYTTSSKKNERERSREPHPIWRGIGLIMMVLIPIVSFALSDVLLQYARTQGVAVPPELRDGMTEIPLYGNVEDLYAVLILAAAIMLVMFALFTIINAAVYRASADKTYQAFESAPKQYKKKRKLRKP